MIIMGNQIKSIKKGSVRGVWVFGCFVAGRVCNGWSSFPFGAGS